MALVVSVTELWTGSALTVSVIRGWSLLYFSLRRMPTPLHRGSFYIKINRQMTGLGYHVTQSVT